MLISFFIGVLLFTVYTVIAECLFGITTSLSETYYKLEKPAGCLFTITLLATSFFIAPLWFDITDENLTFSVFLAVGGLMLVGVAPLFKGVDHKWHEAFAIICAAFAILWQMLNGQYWEAPAFLALFAGIGALTKTLKKCKTFWLEMAAFGSTFTSIFIKYITNEI